MSVRVPVGAGWGGSEATGSDGDAKVDGEGVGESGEEGSSSCADDDNIAVAEEEK